MVQILPGFDKFAGLRQGAQNFVGGLIQQQQQGTQLADQQGLLQFIQQRQAGQNPALPQLQTPQGVSGLSSFISQQPTQFQQEKAKADIAFTKAQTQKATKEALAIDPSTLSIDEKRKRDLLDAGIDAKVISVEEKKLINSQVAKNRAESEKLLRESNGTLSPEQIISQGNTFRKEFDSLSKNFRTIRDSNERLQAAVNDPSAAGDLAVIFNFMKILDPGSVVRESEFATAQNASSVPTAIRNMWNRALNGERISVNRSDFARQASNLVGAQQKTQDKLIARYTGLSNRFGVNPEDVVTQTPSSNKPQGIPSLQQLQGGGSPLINQSPAPGTQQGSVGGQLSLEQIDAELKRRGQ